MFTYLLLGGVGYWLIKKKATTAGTAPVPGVTTGSTITTPPTGSTGNLVGKLVSQDTGTVIDVPNDAYQQYLDDWSARMAARDKRQSQELDLNETDGQMEGLGADLVDGVPNWALFGGAAVAGYYLFLRKK